MAEETFAYLDSLLGQYGIQEGQKRFVWLEQRLALAQQVSGGALERDALRYRHLRRPPPRSHHHVRHTNGKAVSGASLDRAIDEELGYGAPLEAGR